MPGVGDRVQGLNGTSWGTVAGDEGESWKLSTGRHCRKCNEGDTWTFSSTRSSKRTHTQAFPQCTSQPSARKSPIPAFADYVNGRCPIPSVANPGEHRLHDLKKVVEECGLPQSGRVNGGRGSYRLGNLDKRWEKLKGVATALLGRKVAMKQGMHVTLPAAASKFLGRKFDFRITGVKPRFGWSGGTQYVALLVQIRIPGKGWSDQFHGQQLHMSIGLRR